MYTSPPGADDAASGSSCPRIPSATCSWWFEHRPPKGNDGRTETFDLVTFGHYEVREIVRAEEEGPVKEIGPPSWKRLDRESVEVLVGQPLGDL